MNVIKYMVSVILFVFLFMACHKQGERNVDIDKLNQEAFDCRYKDFKLSKNKSEEALKLIEKLAPEDYNAKAKAWNNLAYSYYLTSYFDSAKIYLNKVRNIDAKYENKEIEENITYITEARLLLRECKYAEAFMIYDSIINIFSGNVNKLKYNELLPFKKYDHQRYNWAKSDYLIGNAVLGYYYRNTELSIILESLNKIEQDKNLHIDTTQLSILYYTYAGSYETAISKDIQNLYNALENIKKGLTLLESYHTRNYYQLANFYQIFGGILINGGTKQWMSGKDSTQVNDYITDIKNEYLIKKYNWDIADIESDSLALLLIKRADFLFQKYDDPYQNLASYLLIGDYYVENNDTTQALEYYHKGIKYDTVLIERKGYSCVWKRQLYDTLLKLISEKNSIEEVAHWYNLYSTESAAITKNTTEDYYTQKGKIEAEAEAKRSKSVWLIILSVCAIALVLLYILNKQNNQLKKARSGLGIRNEELEESRKDMELLAKIGKQVVSTLEIGNDLKKIEFINGIYTQIRELKVLAALPDFSFILYIKNNNNELQRYCKENINSEVDISFHSMNETDRPAVGCFIKYGREVLYFNDWDVEYERYANEIGIDSKTFDPDGIISGHSTQSLAFINLFNKKGIKIGVLSFQTTELNAFKKPLLLASFEIIAEYVAAALDNAMQYEELLFIQQKLIEQKRVELLTYVVRGISHELSQPLGSITQTLYETFKDINTLKDEKGTLSDEDYNNIIKNINSDLITISQSKDTISDLVNSFRNTIKENIIDPEVDFILRQRIEDIVKVIKPNIKSNINLIVDCNENIVIRSFPLLFGQVITNLISNANQHAFPNSNDSGDTVRIVCNDSGKDLIVQCIDNGIGIPDNELDKLCQPFVSKKQSNLGLGLSLVKNIVEQYMKGDIRFSSDNGLTATVVIPNCIIKK